MPELNLVWATDLSVTASGDLALVSGTDEGEQRVLRRLLTNPNEYIWNLTYGAGLARFLGTPTAAANIQAVVQSQISQEAIVATMPPPVVTTTAQTNGTVIVTIQYVDAGTGEPNLATFSVGQ